MPSFTGRFETLTADVVTGAAPFTLDDIAEHAGACSAVWYATDDGHDVGIVVGTIRGGGRVLFGIKLNCGCDVTIEMTPGMVLHAVEYLLTANDRAFHEAAEGEAAGQEWLAGRDEP